jgi:phosphatidylinositol alpha-1,6-mannosyltransferase
VKVLALMTDAFGGYGGIAQYNRDLIAALETSEIISKIVALVRIAPELQHGPGGGAPLSFGKKTVQHRPRFGRLNYAVHALITAIRERPDIIISGHLFHGQLALAISKLVGAKLMCQLHGVEVWGPIKRNHLHALELADQVWCVSKDTKGHVDAKSSRSQPNTVVVPNTVAPNFVPRDRAAARLKFSFGQSYSILSVGRLDSREQYKGHDRIIKEMPRLREIRPDIQYIIAGEGDDQPRLENLVHELGLGAAVTFLGKVPFADLPDLYNAADLFALPSTGEGFGIVFLEAMACGTPAIGLAVGGAPDALCHGELGICVEEEAFPAALAQAVQAKPIDRTELAQKVSQKFGHKAFARQVLSTFHKLC